MNKPWDNEPNKLEGTYNGYDWYMKRNDLGAWCGYVCIPDTHPFYKIEEEDYQNLPIKVHGGVTYFRKGNNEEANHIAVIGFDCNHAHDLIPMERSYANSDEKYSTSLFGILLTEFIEGKADKQIYRDITFVKNEIKSMIKQCIEEETNEK